VSYGKAIRNQFEKFIVPEDHMHKNTQEIPTSYPVLHVKLDKFQELTGYTPRAVERKLQEGVWLKGVHVIQVGRIFHMNLREYDLWVQKNQVEGSTRKVSG
jgi:hypothetical protein